MGANVLNSSKYSVRTTMRSAQDANVSESTAKLSQGSLKGNHRKRKKNARKKINPDLSISDHQWLTSTSRMFNRAIPRESASFFSSSVTGPSILTTLFIFSHSLALSNRNRSLMPLHMIVSMSAVNLRVNLKM